MIRRMRWRASRRAAAPIAVVFGLSSFALPAAAVTCSSTSTAGCSALGGGGIPARTGGGGAGNGNGADASTFNFSTGATDIVTGSGSSDGVGGTGATTQDGGGGPGGAVGASAFGAVAINGSVAGVAGTPGTLGTNFGTGGGGGGAGVFFSGSTLSVLTGVTVQGGAGGAGGLGTAPVVSNGGGGGGGGAGIMSAASGASIVSDGSVLGGAGGAGGGGGATGFGGGGGGGGDGVLTFGAGTTFVNTGTVNGGAGGVSGAGSSGTPNTAGGGGAGVRLVGADSVLVNSGAVVGGNSSAGAAGVGVVTYGSAFITNSGTISGGSSAAGNASSIEFGGTGNVLNLMSGSTLNGAITLDAGAAASIAAQNAGLSLTPSVVLTDSASAVTFDGSTTALTVSGAVSGAGSVTVVGASGATTMTGANTYTGSTTITGGTLALSGSGTIAVSSGVADNGLFDISGTTSGASITKLTGSGAVALGSRTLTITNGAGTFSGVIAGSGGVTLTSGNMALAGANTYTGVTTIGAGSLALSGAGAIAASSGVIDNGTLDISGTTSGASIATLSGTGAVALGSKTLTVTNGSTTFGGSINGTGGLTLSGGTLTLSSANSYTGATTIGAGTLALSGAGAFSSATSLGLASSSAVLDLSGAGNQQVASLSGVAGSRVTLGANTLTLGDATDRTFSGTFSGAGALVKQGTGTLTLDGASSAYTGTTTVAAGTLEVGDAANPAARLGGNVQVMSNAALRGHGTVAGNVANSGIVAPGGSIGTLTIGGNYTQASNATLSIEVSPTDGSQLAVGGAATLGGTLHIVYDPGTYTARRYTLVTAVNGINGTFSNVTSAALAGADLSSLQQSIAYRANEVDLALAAAAGPTPSGPGAIVIAPNDTTIYATEGTSALNRAQTTSTALLGRLGSNAASGAGSVETSPAGSWISATGSSTHVSGTDGRPGFLAREYGFLAGVDRREGPYTVGVAAGYSHTSIDESTTGDSSAADTVRVALYGARSFGPIDVAATLGYGLDFLSQKRPFGSIGTAQGDHYGDELTAAMQAGMPLAVGTFTVTPRLGLRYAYFRGNGFGETGAQGQDLAVDADNARSLQPYVSLAIDKAFGSALSPVDVQWRVGYAYEALARSRGLAVASQDGTTFSAPGTNLPRAYLTTGASLSFHPTKAAAVSLGFDALLNVGHASAQSAYARFDYRF